MDILRLVFVSLLVSASSCPSDEPFSPTTRRTGAKKKKQYCHRRRRSSASLGFAIELRAGKTIVNRHQQNMSVISASPEFKSVYCVGRIRKGGFSAPRDRSAVVTGEDCVAVAWLFLEIIARRGYSVEARATQALAQTRAKDVKGPQKSRSSRLCPSEQPKKGLARERYVGGGREDVG